MHTKACPDKRAGVLSYAVKSALSPNAHLGPRLGVYTVYGGVIFRRVGRRSGIFPAKRWLPNGAPPAVSPARRAPPKPACSARVRRRASSPGNVGLTSPVGAPKGAVCLLAADDVVVSISFWWWGSRTLGHDAMKHRGAKRPAVCGERPIDWGRPPPDTVALPVGPPQPVILTYAPPFVKTSLSCTTPSVSMGAPLAVPYKSADSTLAFRYLHRAEWS